MQQGLAVGHDVKVAGLAHELEIEQEHDCRCRVPPQRNELAGEQGKVAEGQRCPQNEQQGRKQPPDATTVERGDAQPALGLLAVQDQRDQIARDDKEDIDAEVAPRHEPGIYMEQQHRQHGQCTQTIDVGSVSDQAQAARVRNAFTQSRRRAAPRRPGAAAPRSDRRKTAGSSPVRPPGDCGPSRLPMHRRGRPAAG